MNTVGKKVRYFRQIKGLSQENLAKYIDKSQNWVSEFENEEKEICISVINHIPVILAITSLSKSLSLKYLLLSL